LNAVQGWVQHRYIGLFDLDFLISSDLMAIELWNFYTYVLVFWG
jgi:hypothetical protein